MLAFNALLLTLVVLGVIAVGLWFAFGRRLFRAVDHACETRDKEREAIELHERLEKQQEARHRAKAEMELDEEFPHLKGGSE